MTRMSLRRSFARSLLVATAGVVVVFAATHRDAIAEGAAAAARLDRRALLCAVVLTAVGVVNRGLQTRRGYLGAGLPIDTLRATALTAAAYSGNKVTRSGGLVGLLAHLHDSRRRALDPTRTVAAYVVITMSGAAGAFVLAATALALASVPSFLALLSVAVLAAWCVPRSPLPRGIVARRARRVAVRLGGPVDVDEVGEACRAIGRAHEHLAWVVVHAVAGKVLGALTLVVILHGVGAADLGMETTMRLYALALVAAALSPLPAGLGTTEASLAASLVAAGVDDGTALGAALAFRLFDLWVPVAIGALAAPVALRRRGVPPSRAAGADGTAAGEVSSIAMPG